MNKNWYVLAVQPRKESFVQQQLLASGQTVICPRYKKTVSHARRVKTISSPLFSGYLFVELVTNSQSWRKVNWVPGSIGLITFDQRPSPLNRDFVENFLSRVGSDGMVNFKQDFKIGDRVQAVGGPFDRYIGEVIEMSTNDRIKILMEALNRKIKMTMPTGAVVAAA